MIIKDIVVCSYVVFLFLQPLPQTVVTSEGHCCWICHWPGKFILWSYVWGWDENDPAPRSFIHVTCSCTYMFAISMRDVVALLNAACFALTMAKLRHAFCTKRGILYLFRCIILGQAYHVVLPFWQLVFVDCPYFNLSTFICTSISLCFIWAVKFYFWWQQSIILVWGMHIILLLLCYIWAVKNT